MDDTNKNTKQNHENMCDYCGNLMEMCTCACPYCGETNSCECCLFDAATGGG